MATDFIMPRLPDAQPSAAFFQQQLPAPMPMPYQPPPSQYTPQVSPLSTSGNASPTSPKTYITRQIRPLYMPAVLRPTEFPSKAPPPKPIVDHEEDVDERTLRPSSSFISLPGLGALGRLSRRSTGDSGKCVDMNWDLDQFPKPTGVPTRRHWKPDQESALCDHATCKRYFTYFTRRHHCRRCGNIFCDYHSAFEIPLDQDANYNPRGTLSRSCAHCYSEFKEWRSRTNSQSVLDSPDIITGQIPTSPITASPATAGAKGQYAEVAQSVPRDWNWSTF